ncbi:MAG: type II 3-dehydroquinate dehydratase [Crocinitomix sp.]|nr:type II 3-dehydroquinate dehydratase [Crocinitomix sp.]
MMRAKQILILNGPNLNLLGKREPETYGAKSFEEYFVELKAEFPALELSYFQSNLEGELVDKIQEPNWDGIVLNSAGYSHTSVALRDVVSAVKTPVVEVHISNIAARESFRHDSLISPVAVGCITGFGLKSYALALNYYLD